MAPEIIQRDLLDKSIEVHAFDIILYELMIERCAFLECYKFEPYTAQLNDSVPLTISKLMICRRDENPSIDSLSRKFAEYFVKHFMTHAWDEREEAQKFPVSNIEDEQCIRFSDLCDLAVWKYVDLRST